MFHIGKVAGRFHRGFRASSLIGPVAGRNSGQPPVPMVNVHQGRGSMATNTEKLLADALGEYFSPYELEDLCARFEISLDYSGNQPNLLNLARKLVHEDDARKRRFLSALVNVLVKRCQDQIENTAHEDSLYHQQMMLQIRQLKPPVPGEIPETPRPRPTGSHPQLALFFARARTELTLVDPEPGTGTLQCLLLVKQPIRMLLQKGPEARDAKYLHGLKELQAHGRQIRVREYPELHDRIVAFNNRCWIAGAPLRSAVRKRIPLIEVIDARRSVLRLVEDRWREAQALF